MNYPLLKKSLNFEIALNWFIEDSKDDFFPDPLNWADIKNFPIQYLETRQHRILQVDALAYLKEYIPKRSGLLREALWLHPLHRIVYLAILHRLLPRLNSKIFEQVYSYRVDTPNNPDEYPFKNKMERWKQFHNDFREAALEKGSGAVLLTDLASFFDHINCGYLEMTIKNLLSATLNDEDEEVIKLLIQLLKMWGDNGFGMPHNLDASSFFGSLYLHNVDYEIITHRYRYFRWIDDIRIVATDRRQAIRALHELQKALSKHRLFLATDKTFIYEKEDKEFKELLDVEDDRIISSSEQIISLGVKKDIERVVDILFSRLALHSKHGGDESEKKCNAPH